MNYIEKNIYILKLPFFISGISRESSGIGKRITTTLTSVTFGIGQRITTTLISLNFAINTFIAKGICQRITTTSKLFFSTLTLTMFKPIQFQLCFNIFSIGTSGVGHRITTTPISMNNGNFTFKMCCLLSKSFKKFLFMRPTTK